MRRTNEYNNSNNTRNTGHWFLTFVVLLIVICYSIYVGLLLLPNFLRGYQGTIQIFFIFNFFFFNFLSAFILSVNTDPGSVPPNWGFYMGDDAKRRRYCKICNVWKPERTHHCSACNRCILNMDHHCPWINNCVGFKNRRFFIQLLVYSIACLLFMLVQSFRYLFIDAIYNFAIDTIEGTSLLQYVAICSLLLISFILLSGLLPFTKFHLSLAFRNLTTIENHDPISRKHSPFDIGSVHNLEQVFGPAPICWLNPCASRALKPRGDGLRWNLYETPTANCPSQYTMPMNQP